MMRPRQHGLAVLTSSTPILTLVVFIVAIFYGLEVYMSRTCPIVNGKEIIAASPSTVLSSFL